MHLNLHFVLCLALAACSSAPERTDVEARSLLGEVLRRPTLAPERAAELNQALAAAEADWRADPSSELAAIWVGRRLAYQTRYRDAVEWYTQRLVDFPDSYRLLRHRGHRYISLRNFDAAIADLTRASILARDVPDAIEPDGAPNRFGIPRSTTKSNIYYHLGLAHYLQADYEAALDAYRLALGRNGINDDNRVSATHWLYLILRRLGRDAEAAAVVQPIHSELAVIENTGYWKLCLLYRGDLTHQDVLEAARGDGIGFASVANGVAAWSLANGAEDCAYEIWAEIAAGDAWSAFGHIAAEVEIARQGARER